MSDEPGKSALLALLAETATLEKHYGVGTATVARALLKHQKLPKALTPKKAQKWVETFARATGYAGRE